MINMPPGQLPERNQLQGFWNWFSLCIAGKNAINAMRLLWKRAIPQVVMNPSVFKGKA
jgi:hypothetical protein